MNRDGKSNESMNARKDLAALQIKHLQRMDGGKVIMPQASHALTSSKKKKFLEVLKDIKVPDEFLSNLS